MRALRYLAACALLAGPIAAVRPAAAEELPVYAIVLRDGRITPSRLEVPARRRFKLAIRNDGPGPCELENLELHIEKVVAAGVSSFVVVHSLPPGTHRFVDEFHPDTGRLDVVAR